MPTITIDNQDVTVAAGATVLDAAAAAGIAIPTLCFLEGCRAETSCMVCVVDVKGRAGLVPACATQVEDGMVVESDADHVREARKAALELLLSDHLGDCIAPCQVACPCSMNIPRMLRQIRDGHLRQAIETVKSRIAFPAVLGRLCHAPCEKACRRGRADAPVSICLLKRYAADADLAADTPFLPSKAPDTGKRVAIVGAGPGGLAAAYYLLRMGHACTIHDENDTPGGMLRRAVEPDRLPPDVLDAEIEIVRRLGAEFELGRRIEGGALVHLRSESDAVLLATGDQGDSGPDYLGVALTDSGIEVERHTFETSEAGLFAVGGAVRATKRSVQTIGAARQAAVAVGQYLAGAEVVGEAREFSTHIGKPLEGEMEAFMPEGSDSPRVEPAGGDGAGLSEAEAVTEAARCLHCDCRDAENCRLREFSAACDARPGRYKDGNRAAFKQEARHDLVIYEPGKCIKCGLCVQVARRAGEALGLTFTGRGFDVRIGVPFDEPLSAGLALAAAECAAACPTGALAMKQSPPCSGAEPSETS